MKLEFINENNSIKNEFNKRRKRYQSILLTDNKDFLIIITEFRRTKQDLKKIYKEEKWALVISHIL